MIDQFDISSIYNQFGDDLFSYGRHLGFGEDTVMDAIHDVFYKVCIAPKTLESVSNLKFYLFRMLKNRLIDINRGNREIVGSDLTNEQVYGSITCKLDVTIEDEIIEKEDQAEIINRIEKLLDSLSDRQREIVYLRYIHEYDYEEIAELMQISVLSCRNLISKSISKLKESTIPIALIILIIR